MKARALIGKLERLITKYGDLPVELWTPEFAGIVDADVVRFEQSDAERGNTFVIEGE